MSNYNGLKVKEKLSFGIAGFGQNMVINFVTTFMLIYLYEGIGFTTAGMAALTVILTAARIWDAVNDLIMGVIVDRTRTRWGKLRPYILFTAAPIALLTIMMFAVPDIKEGYQLLFFGTAYLLWDMLYTMSDVPYWGLTGAMTSDTNERTKLISLARTAGLFGLALTALSGPHLARWLSFSDKTTARGWTYASILISVIGMGLFTLAFFNTRERIEYSEKRTTLKQTISTILANKPLFLILAGSALNFGSGILQVGGAVVAFIIFGDEGMFTLLGGALILANLLSITLTPVLLKKMSKRTLIIGSSVLSATAYGVMYIIGYNSIPISVLIIFLTGFFSGFFSVSQTAMIADTVDYIEYQTGERNEGVCFSGLTFVSKLMSAMATTAFGIVVTVVGYSKGVDITPYIKSGVYFSITVIPAVSCLLSLIPFLFYKLTEKKLAGMMEVVMERRKNKELPLKKE